MKIKMLKIAGILSLTLIIPGLTWAANPASQEWVKNYVKTQLAEQAPSLTAADWAAVCTTGSPTSSTGCYGNIASPAFAKLNARIGAGGFTDQINIPVISTPNSVFIQQYNGNSQVPSTASQSPQVQIPVSSSPAQCSFFTTAGANLSYEGMILGESGEVGGAIKYVQNDGTFTTIYERADEESTPPIVVVYYVLCIGVTTPTALVNPTPGSLSNLVAN